MHPFYANTVGDVKVKVPGLYLQKAIEVLEIPVETSEDEDTSHCPYCRSVDIEYEKLSWPFAFISSLLVYIPIPFFRRRWKCNNCGHKWRSRSMEPKNNES